MTYYKIIANNVFIGVITSASFLRQNSISKWFLSCDVSSGQYVQYGNVLYRDYWMAPLFDWNSRNYTNAVITEITQEEYDILIQAIEADEEIPILEEKVERPPIAIIEEDTDAIATLEYVRTAKISEMSYTCRTTIENGFDLELRNETHHFSLDTQDQLNLISLSAMAQTQSMIPYHADGESCIFYTSEEINEIVETATAFKIYHTTYYNALKGYINSLETIEEIAAIEYGTPIPEEYKSDVLRVLEA